VLPNPNIVVNQEGLLGLWIRGLRHRIAPYPVGTPGRTNFYEEAESGLRNTHPDLSLLVLRSRNKGMQGLAIAMDRASGKLF
jgi:hypothetical protein